LPFFNQAPRHEGVLGSRVITPRILWPRTRGRWVVSFAPRPLNPQGKTHGTNWIGGWVGPRAVLDAVVTRKILIPRRESNPITPIVQPVAQSYTDWAITALTSRGEMKKKKKAQVSFWNSNEVPSLNHLLQTNFWKTTQGIINNGLERKWRIVMTNLKEIICHRRILLFIGNDRFIKRKGTSHSSIIKTFTAINMEMIFTFYLYPVFLRQGRTGVEHIADSIQYFRSKPSIRNS
jgi:hypothetical protein